MTSFRKPTQVTRRMPGAWVDGRWVPGPEVEMTILATVQPASATDFGTVRETRGGRWPQKLLVLYTSAELRIASDDERPGDVLHYAGDDYVAVLGARHDVLGTRVSHNRYLMALRAELEVENA